MTDTRQSVCSLHNWLPPQEVCETISKAYANFLHAFAVIVLPISFAVVVLIILAKLFGDRPMRSAAVGHGIVFGLFGLVVALLYVLRLPGLQGLLPHAIVFATLLFQLMGRVGNRNKRWSVPLEERPALVGAATGVALFLFGVLYFYRFPEITKFRDPPISTTAQTSAPPPK